jgi:trans-aconitate methyltransferase
VVQEELQKFWQKKFQMERYNAVDNDVNMIDKAKDNLSQFENVTIINSDLLDLSLKIILSKVDVIFSSAVLHWILIIKSYSIHFLNY